MKQHPLVSVFMPVYNQVEFITEAIESALTQDYPNLQIVIGDDGSTDGTAAIVLKYAKEYPNIITAIVGEPHLGITGNCNRVLRQCKGKYISFHAGDDVMLPGKIKAQVRWLEEDEDRVLCGHDVDVFNSDTGKTMFRWSEKYEKYDLFRVRQGGADFVRHNCFIAGQSIMVRVSAVPGFGFDERIPIASDWKMWIDILANGGEYACIEGVYSRYRRHQGGVTRAFRQQCLADQRKTLDIVYSSYPHLRNAVQYARKHQEHLYPGWSARMKKWRRRAKRWVPTGVKNIVKAIYSPS